MCEIKLFAQIFWYFTFDDIKAVASRNLVVVSIVFFFLLFFFFFFFFFLFFFLFLRCRYGRQLKVFINHICISYSFRFSSIKRKLGNTLKSMGITGSC